MVRKRKPPTRRRLPATRQSTTHKVTITDPIAGSLDVYIIVGFYPDGSPGELFVKVGKEGSTLHGLLNVACIQTSLLLQYGIPLSQIVQKLTGIMFVPGGKTDDSDIPICLSIIDYIFRWMEKEFS